MQANQTPNDEIRLSEILMTLWKEKVLIIIVTFLFSIGFVLYALSLPNMYRSTVVTVPASDEGASGLSALASQFGGLASMAGVNLGGGNTDLTVTLETLKSKGFLMHFIEKYNIEKELMAVDGYSLSSEEFSYDPEVYDVASKTWVREVPLPKKAQPSSQELYLYMKNEYLKIAHDPNNNVITISFTHFSPVFAQQVVTNLVKEFNAIMKEKDIKEATASIEYLNDMVGTTAVNDHKVVFFKLIEQQQQKKMLASIRDNYALQVVDPAIVAEEKSSPKRAMLVLMGAFFGGIFATILAFIRQAYKRRKA